MWGSQVTGSIEIDRPVEEVFDLVADERNEPLYNLDMISSEKLTDGPIGVGTRFGATNRSFGRPVSMVIEVTAFERPHRLASTTRMEGMVLDGGLTFDPTGRGTRMSWSWSLHPTGPMRLLTPLLAMVGRRNERRIWTGLKHHLESRTERRNHRVHHRAPG